MLVAVRATRNSALLGVLELGLAFKASFVAPGRTNFLSTNLN